MLRFVAETLDSDEPIGVVEAGTGTGKTIALCAGAIPIAREKKKSLVVVTATVGLQSQLLNQELLDLARLDEEPITFEAAKGRRRYVCLAKLERFQTGLGISEGSPESGARMHEMNAPSELFRRFRNRLWDGDLDRAPISIEPELMPVITTDKFGCQGTSCKWYDECPYYVMREEVRQADVVVTNYDLLLQDLLIDSQILPDPESSIYLFDEAHKLHDKALSAFSKQLDLSELVAWLRNLQDHLVDLVPRLNDQRVITIPLGVINEQRDSVLNHIDEIRIVVKEYFHGTTENRFSFEQGVVPTDLVFLIRGVLNPLNRIVETLEDINTQLREVSEGRSDWIPNDLIPEQAESMGKFQADGESFVDLLKDWADQSDSKEAARWVTADIRGGEHYVFSTVYVDVDDRLQKMLWQLCAGAICTSATLRTTDGFGHFLAQVGLPTSVEQLGLDSPFNFGRQVRLAVPPMKFQPQHDEHDAEIAKRLPKLLLSDLSGLVIFSSYASMNAVLDLLSKSFQKHCLVQGRQSWDSTIAQHKTRIESNQKSYLFGLAAFREGIDLADDLCRHVVITRLPFEVPTDPVLKSRKERLAVQGFTDYEIFLKLELPEMSLRLKQACGRLMRSEDDFGKITILDERILTKRYGPSVLNALPPYRRSF